jgi:hypothetical protein
LATARVSVSTSPAAACLDLLAGGREPTGLAWAGGAFDDGDLLVAGRR